MIASRDNGVALAPLSRQLPEYPVYIASTSVPEVYPQVVKIEKKLASLDALTVGPVDLVVPMWALKNETMMILAQFEDSGEEDFWMLYFNYILFKKKEKRKYSLSHIPFYMSS